MGEQLELFEKTSEKTARKEKTRTEARAQAEDLRRPQACRRCGFKVRPWYDYLEQGETYYVCMGCGAINEWR
jgi:DNA-directed RNA polymerase subunit RPC12/RpoP